MSKNIRWLAYQPLIGGMDIGAEKAFGCPPTAVLDYDGIANSELYLNYMNEVKGNKLKHFYLNGGAYSLAEDFKPEVDAEGNEKVVWNWDMPEFKDLDVVVGVPICAGLSSANTQSGSNSKMGRGSDAVQNNNMLGMLSNVLKYLKPKVYIFENAYKLATPLGAGIKEKLTKMANDAGYGVNLVKVNTLHHGLPQNRTRTFMICVKDSNAPYLEYDGPAPIPAIMDIIGDLPKQQGACQVRSGDDGWIKYLKNKWGDKYREEWAKHNAAADFCADECGELAYAKQFFDRQKDKDDIDYFISKKAQGKGWMSGAPLYFGTHKLPSLYGRSMGRIWHPVEERGYSIRECMRLMALPDDFPEVPKQKMGMIGQNVPVCTAQYYCNEVKKFLEGKLNIAETQNVDQDFCSEAKTKPKKSIPSGFNKFMK
jgi:DNA (cytosine-5)-methyltransferase 1